MRINYINIENVEDITGLLNSIFKDDDDYEEEYRKSCVKAENIIDFNKRLLKAPIRAEYVNFKKLINIYTIKMNLTLTYFIKNDKVNAIKYFKETQEASLAFMDATENEGDLLKAAKTIKISYDIMRKLTWADGSTIGKGLKD